MKLFLLFLIFQNYAPPTNEELDDAIKETIVRVVTLEQNEAVMRNQLQNTEKNITELRSDLRSARDDLREAKKKSPWVKALIISSCIFVILLLFFVIKVYYQLF